MTDRHVNRSNVVLRPQHSANQFVAIQERHRRTPTGVGLLMHSDQASLCAADGWKIKQQAEVAGYAEAPRMSDPMPVTDDEIGRLLELCKCLENGGKLTERKETRNIRERRFSFGGSDLDLAQRRRVQNSDGRDDTVALIGVSHVDAGHCGDISDLVMSDNFQRQT